MKDAQDYQNAIDEKYRDDAKLKKDDYFKACKAGDYETVQLLLNDTKMIMVKELDEYNWTGLNYAVMHNHPDLVKLIYPKQKEVEEKELKEKKLKQAQAASSHHISETDDPFQKPLNPANNGKYTPLHWSAYKSLDVISSILLKLGCNPMDVDSYGNNALHQAAASNNEKTFILFMGLGMGIEYKNSRNHAPIDLTTNKKIQDLIVKCFNKDICEICNKKFTFSNKRFLCCIDERVICKECCVVDYYFENDTAKEKDVRECRCRKCYDEINQLEKDLRDAIKSNNLENLHNHFDKCNGKRIDCKLIKESKFNLDRLTREKQITELLDSLKVVPNHKTIEKSVYILDEMLKSADDNKIPLDKKIIQRAFLERNRLLAERDLRKELDNMCIEKVSEENLKTLTEKVTNAKKCNVADVYYNKGADLEEKMKLHLLAVALMDSFVKYPIREYPVVEVVDPKKKKKAPPPPKKKKKKKKEPPFLVPDWAKELNELVKKVDEMKSYVAKAVDLGLNKEFVTNANLQLKRFGQEIPFRRAEEEAQKKLEEEKAAKKKKKKK